MSSGSSDGRPLVATFRVVYWKDIPTMVRATDGSGTVKVELSGRFQALVDATAMRLGLVDADEYLAQWHQGVEENRPGSAREVAQAVAAELENRFAEFRGRSSEE
jgi:hypothetical protein